MKLKTLVLSLFLVFSGWTFGQITGDVIESGRKVEKEVDYQVKKHYYAKIVIDIAVNTDGEVTSAKLNSKASTKNSTPLTIECVNRAKKIKFEKGNMYPKFHNGKVIFSVSPQDESD